MPIEWAKYRDCTNTFIESFGFYSGSFFHFLFDGANEIYLYISSFYMTWTETKGQIMSECIYEIIDFPKYHQKNLIDFCPERLFRLGMLCTHLSRVAFRIIKTNDTYLVYKTFQGRNLSNFFGGILENWWFHKYIIMT